MKFVFLFLIIAILSSCSPKNKSTDNQKNPRDEELINISGNIHCETTTNPTENRFLYANHEKEIPEVSCSLSNYAKGGTTSSDGELVLISGIAKDCTTEGAIIFNDTGTGSKALSGRVSLSLSGQDYCRIMIGIQDKITGEKTPINSITYYVKADSFELVASNGTLSRDLSQASVSLINKRTNEIITSNGIECLNYQIGEGAVTNGCLPGFSLNSVGQAGGIPIETAAGTIKMHFTYNANGIVYETKTPLIIHDYDREESLTLNKTLDGTIINATSSSGISFSGICKNIETLDGLAVMNQDTVGSDYTAIASELSCESNNTYIHVADMSSSAYSDGNYVVTINGTSNTGSSISDTFSFTLDKIKASVAINNLASNDFIGSPRQPISGTCSEVGLPVMITYASRSDVSMCEEGGAWSSILHISHLPDNEPFNVSVSHQDGALNDSAQQTITLNKDTSYPVLALATPVNGQIVDVSNVSSLAVSGTCTKVGTVTITHPMGSSQTACVDGAFSFSLDISGVSDGTQRITAYMVDERGHQSSSDMRLIVKDIEKPLLAVVSPTQNQTVENGVNFSGSCSEEGQPVVVMENGKKISGVLCTSSTFSIAVDLGEYPIGPMQMVVRHINLSSMKEAQYISINLVKQVNPPIQQNALYIAPRIQLNGGQSGQPGEEIIVTSDENALFTDNGSFTLGYQWQKSSSTDSLNTFEDIAGETNLSLIVNKSDAGKKVRLLITASDNDANSTIATSNELTLDSPNSPAVLALSGSLDDQCRINIPFSIKHNIDTDLFTQLEVTFGSQTNSMLPITKEGKFFANGQVATTIGVTPTAGSVQSLQLTVQDSLGFSINRQLSTMVVPAVAHKELSSLGVDIIDGIQSTEKQFYPGFQPQIETSQLSNMCNGTVGGDSNCTSSSFQLESNGDLLCFTNNADLYCKGGYLIRGNNTLLYGVGAPPTKVESLSGSGSNINSVVMGKHAAMERACVIKNNGEVWCWGKDSCYMGFSGALDPTITPGSSCEYTLETDPSKKPIPFKLDIPGNPVMVQLALGYYHTCGIDTNGEVWCWGNGWYFQSYGGGGNGTDPINMDFNTRFPEKFLSGEHMVQISAQNNAMCSLSNLGNVFCWGNSSGLGVGPSASRTQLYKVSLGSLAVKIRSGQEITCALLNNGKSQCWGLNAVLAGLGSSLDGTLNSLTPRYVIDENENHLMNIVDISISSSSATGASVSPPNVRACYLLKDGSVRCSGYRARGDGFNNIFTSFPSWIMSQVEGFAYKVNANPGNVYKILNQNNYHRRDITAINASYMVNSLGEIEYLNDGASTKIVMPIELHGLNVGSCDVYDLTNPISIE